MLTIQDCFGFSRLTPEQIEAIADHQHLEMIVAAEWGECMLDRPGGRAVVERVILEEIDHCRAHGDMARCRRYQCCLADFKRGQRGVH